MAVNRAEFRAKHLFLKCLLFCKDDHSLFLLKVTSLHPLSFTSANKMIYLQSGSATQKMFVQLKLRSASLTLTHCH